jgi:probable phosphoglycerate mutase
MHYYDVMTEIYVLRHGETAYNKEGRYLGRTDVSAIFDFDKKEIEEFKSHIESLTFNLIISSPLKRCLETAEILIGKKNVMINDSFVERSVGVYEGLTKEEAREKYQIFTQRTKPDSLTMLHLAEKQFWMSRREFLLHWIK